MCLIYLQYNIYCYADFSIHFLYIILKSIILNIVDYVYQIKHNAAKPQTTFILYFNIFSSKLTITHQLYFKTNLYDTYGLEHVYFGKTVLLIYFLDSDKSYTYGIYFVRIKVYLVTFVHNTNGTAPFQQDSIYKTNWRDQIKYVLRKSSSTEQCG